MRRASAERISPDELQDLFARQRDAIRARLEDFARVPEKDYFYELAYCLMTPQSSAVRAGKVIELLRQQGFEEREFDVEPLLRRRDCYIRFHRTKADRLRAARVQFEEIRSRIRQRGDAAELRAWLVRNVKGLGWKEASHFLRNIGYRDLAILDRHILRNLVRAGAIRSLPKTLTPKHYTRVERAFARFADSVGIPMDELDLLFWSMETGEILK